MQALKRLRTIAGALLCELECKLPEPILVECLDDFVLYDRVLKQQKNDKDKIYSLHEPQVYCVAKGKDYKPYEYGAKASIVSTEKEGIIFSAVSHPENIHDSNTLEEVIDKAHDVRETKIKESACDRGYRGVSLVNETKTILPKGKLKLDNRYQRDKK